MKSSVVTVLAQLAVIEPTDRKVGFPRFLGNEDLVVSETVDEQIRW